MPAVSTKKAHLILLMILMVSFGLNLHGNDFQLEYHVDEPKKVTFITDGTQDFRHPILILQVVRLANSVVGLVDRQQVAVLSRITTAIFGTLLVLLTYKIARQTIPKSYALAVALLTAIAPGVVIHSHYLKEDMAFTFAIVLSLYWFFRFVERVLSAENLTQHILLLGLTIGLLVSAKYKSGIVLFAFCAAPIYIAQLRSFTYYRGVFTSFVIGFFTFLLINFPILTNFETFTEGFTYELEHAFTGHNGINIYPLEQLFTFHLKHSVIPSIAILPVILAVGFILYALFRWQTIGWRDRFLVAFILIYYAILESSPLKPFPGFVRYALPLVPFLAYACIQAIWVTANRVSSQARAPFALLLTGLVLIFPFYDSLNLVYYMNRDTRATLLDMVATNDEPVAFELYANPNEQTVKSLIQLDLKGAHKQYCTVVASSFMYERYFFAQDLSNQDPIVPASAEIYHKLFSFPYVEIIPEHKSFAFSNPTLRIIDVCHLDVNSPVVHDVTEQLALLRVNNDTPGKRSDQTIQLTTDWRLTPHADLPTEICLSLGEISRSCQPFAYTLTDENAPQVVQTQQQIKVDKHVQPADYPLIAQFMVNGEPASTPFTLLTATIAGPARQFESPTIVQPLTIDFGDELQLLGHDALIATDSTLHLMLYWQAIVSNSRAAKYFVHVMDDNGNIVAQVDAMPRNWTYPTSEWAAQEIVSDLIELDIQTVPAGTYQVYLGMVDAETGERLQATDRLHAGVSYEALWLDTLTIEP